MGFVFVNHGQCISTVQALEGGQHRLQQIAVIQTVHQVHDDFGVGLAEKLIALALQVAAQAFIVLNDAVVHQTHAGRQWRGAVQCADGGFRHGHGACAEVGVSVVHGRHAVGGPARVGDAGVALKGLAGYLVSRKLGLQFGHSAGGACALQPTCMDGDAAGVITPVFQPLQALNQDGDDVAVRD